MNNIESDFHGIFIEKHCFYSISCIIQNPIVSVLHCHMPFFSNIETQVQTPTCKFGVGLTCISDKPVNQKLLLPYSTNLSSFRIQNILDSSVKSFFDQNLSEGEFFF